MRVIANGKLILSGEHAVVYGNPALAMAVDRQVIVTLEKKSLLDSDLFLQLPNLKKVVRLGLDSLKKIYGSVREYYTHFLSGQKSIREVLQQPEELLLFAAGLLYSQKDFDLPFGIHVHVDSNIPLGSGMGSSAATVLALLYGLSKKLELPFSEEKIFELALQAENMQHGKSSGLDLRVILKGGVIRYEKNPHPICQERPIPNFPLYLIDTGRPQNTTGECVSLVAPLFNAELLARFREVTDQMDKGLLTQDAHLFRSAIQLNHHLLCEIGVVPKRIQACIAELEANQMSAKICGAGAISGDNAGMVLVYSDNPIELAKILSKWNFTFSKVCGVFGGVHVG